MELDAADKLGNVRSKRYATISASRSYMSMGK